LITQPLAWLGVLPTVKFNDQPVRKTDKIHDVFPNGFLSSEFRAAQLFRP